jgi:hypothetical protein
MKPVSKFPAVLHFLLLSFDVSGLESDFRKGWKFGRNIILKQRCIVAHRSFMCQLKIYIFCFTPTEATLETMPLNPSVGHSYTAESNDQNV